MNPPACNAAQNGWMISGRIRVLNMTIDAPILECERASSEATRTRSPSSPSLYELRLDDDRVRALSSLQQETG
jgi:hypothetical protein